MKKESLIKLREVVIKAILEYNDPTVESIEKLEVAINERLFLQPEKYENNIKVLQKEHIKSQYKK